MRLTIIAMACLTLVFQVSFPSFALEIPPGALSEFFERPPEEDLTPLPSLDLEERHELQERLEALDQLYRAKVYEARAEHYGLTQEELERRIGTLDNWPPVNAVPLRPEHDPWLYETAWGLWEEEPVDWPTLRLALRIFPRTHVASDARRDALARRILEHPIGSNMARQGQVGAIILSSITLLNDWPDDALDILEVVISLPLQPREREILPVAEGDARPVEDEQRIANRIRQVLGGRDLAKAEALLERIETAVDRGEYTLNGEWGRDQLDLLRQIAEDAVPPPPPASPPPQPRE